MCVAVEKSLSTLTLNVLFIRKLSMILISHFGNLCSFNLQMSPWCQIMSNAFSESSNSTAVDSSQLLDCTPLDSKAIGIR